MEESAAEQANAVLTNEEKGLEESDTQQASNETLEKKTKVDEEQIYNTKLGRKVKDTETKLESLVDTQRQLLASIEELKELQTKSTKPSGDQEDRFGSDLFEQMCQVEQPPVEFVTTPKEQVLMNDWSNRVMSKIDQRSRSAYSSTYLKTADSFKEKGGEYHEEVIKMITDLDAPFNIKHTSRGDVDARINYAEALSALVSGKIKDPRWGGGKAKAGVTTSATSSTSTKPVPKMTGYAEDYLKHLGWGDKEISSAMERNIIRKG